MGFNSGFKGLNSYSWAIYMCFSNFSNYKQRRRAK